MLKYWYFVAMVIFTDKTVYYSGYVVSKDHFPVNVAEIQSMDYADDRPMFEKRVDFKQTLIINQVEVDEARFETWKSLKKL